MKKVVHNSAMEIDPRNGFCKSNSIFYSKRSPISLPPNQSLDVTTFISSTAHPGTVAFIDSHSGNKITFSELWTSVDSVSESLYDIGTRKGDVVLILSPNSINFPIVCLSVMSLGAIITTANPLYTAREISNQIADSKPKLAFTTRELAPKLVQCNIPIVLLDGENNKEEMSDMRVSQDGENKGMVKMKIVATLDEMRRKEMSGTRVRERVNQDDPATLLYSSGTTGVSKGVVSSHKSLIAMTQSGVDRFRGAKILLCTVPMFHIYGMAAFVISQVATGSTVVIMSKFSINDMLISIEKFRVTYLPLVPPILMVLINDADRIKREYDLSSMRTVLSGGAPLSKEVIEGFVAKYPTVEILQGYGLTESTGTGSSTDCLEESRKYGTAGLLSPNIEAKIVDTKTGAALSVNETGELWIRGQSIMKGYFGNEEATKATIDDDGWLKTGDLCYIDDDGFLFVVDRLKELIKYKGYQVPPAELEALLLTHPQIDDAAVIPFPDKDVGQFPMAYVVRKSGSTLSEADIISFVAQQVAPYKKVRRVSFVSSVPKNPSGKILRKDLIKLATSRL